MLTAIQVAGPEQLVLHAQRCPVTAQSFCPLVAHSFLLASLVFISKEQSFSQVPLGLRAKAFGRDPRCTKGPGIPAVCL